MVKYKFNEDQLVQELIEYVDKTYDQHYATDKYQATDIIIDSGHGTGFCLGNVIKYAKRYGRKGNAKEARKDLMKILHYALIQLDVHDQEHKKKFTPDQHEDGYPEYDLKIASDRLMYGLDGVTPEEWDNISKNSDHFRKHRRAHEYED